MTYRRIPTRYIPTTAAELDECRKSETVEWLRFDRTAFRTPGVIDSEAMAHVEYRERVDDSNLLMWLQVNE